MKKDILNFLNDEREKLKRQFKFYWYLKSIDNDDYSIIENLIEIESKLILIDEIITEFDKNA